MNLGKISGLITIALAVSVSHSASGQTATDVICNGCIGTTDINNEAISAPDIRDDAIRRRHILDSAVGRNEIAPLSIGSSKIRGGAVTPNKLSGGFISVGPSDVQADLPSGCEWEHRSTQSSGFWATGVSDCDGITELQLPHGKTLTSLSCTFTDDAGNSNSGAGYMRRYLAVGGGLQDVLSTPFTSDSGKETVSDNTPEVGTAIVDNSTYVYKLVLFWDNGSTGADLLYHGCVIAYD